MANFSAYYLHLYGLCKIIKPEVYCIFIYAIKLSFLSHQVAVHLYSQLKMDVGHRKYALQTQTCVFPLQK